MNDKECYFITDGERAAIYIRVNAFVEEYNALKEYVKSYLKDFRLNIEVANSIDGGLFVSILSCFFLPRT